MAYKSPEVFFLTKNTQPKAPYPKGLINSKSFNPISCYYLTLSALILTTSESELYPLSTVITSKSKDYLGFYTTATLYFILFLEFSGWKILFFGFLIESGSISAVFTISASLEEELEGERSALSSLIGSGYKGGDSSLSRSVIWLNPRSICNGFCSN